MFRPNGSIKVVSGALVEPSATSYIAAARRDSSLIHQQSVTNGLGRSLKSEPLYGVNAASRSGLAR